MGVKGLIFGKGGNFTVNDIFVFSISIHVLDKLCIQYLVLYFCKPKDLYNIYLFY